MHDRSYPQHATPHSFDYPLTHFGYIPGSMMLDMSVLAAKPVVQKPHHRLGWEDEFKQLREGEMPLGLPTPREESMELGDDLSLPRVVPTSVLSQKEKDRDSTKDDKKSQPAASLVQVAHSLSLKNNEMPLRWHWGEFRGLYLIQGTNLYIYALLKLGYQRSLQGEIKIYCKEKKLSSCKAATCDRYVIVLSKSKYKSAIPIPQQDYEANKKFYEFDLRNLSAEQKKGIPTLSLPELREKVTQLKTTRKGPIQSCLRFISLFKFAEQNQVKIPADSLVLTPLGKP